MGGRFDFASSSFDIFYLLAGFNFIHVASPNHSLERCCDKRISSLYILRKGAVRGSPPAELHSDSSYMLAYDMLNKSCGMVNHTICDAITHEFFKSISRFTVSNTFFEN